MIAPAVPRPTSPPTTPSARARPRPPPLPRQPPPSPASAPAPTTATGINVSTGQPRAGSRPRAERTERRRSNAERVLGGVLGSGAGLTVGGSALLADVAGGAGDGAGGGGADSGSGGAGSGGDAEEGSAVRRTVSDIVEVVPEPVKMLLVALAVLAAALGGGYLLLAERGRRLARQRCGPAPGGRPAADRAAAAGARDRRAPCAPRWPTGPRTAPAPVATSTTRSRSPAAARPSSSATCRVTAARRSPAPRSCATRSGLPRGRPRAARSRSRWPGA